MKLNLSAKVLGILILISFLSTGCSYNISEYGASIDNVNHIKSIDKKINIQKFTSSQPGLASITCRAAGSVGTPNNVPFETFIKDAFVSELQLAGKYDSKSEITIYGHLEEIDFNSNIGTANWKFTLKLTSSNTKSIVVNSTHEFEGSFVADKACQGVAQEFVPAVQKLISDIVSDRNFKTLL